MNRRFGRPRRNHREHRKRSTDHFASGACWRGVSSPRRTARGMRTTGRSEATTEDRNRLGRTWPLRSADGPPVPTGRQNRRGRDEGAARSRAAGPWSSEQATISARAVRRAQKYPAQRPRPGGGFRSVHPTSSVFGTHSDGSERPGGGFRRRHHTSSDYSITHLSDSANTKSTSRGVETP